jgi:hypothetical protein
MNGTKRDRQDLTVIPIKFISGSEPATITLQILENDISS